jgi:hypothetical protein
MFFNIHYNLYIIEPYNELCDSFTENNRRFNDNKNFLFDKKYLNFSFMVIGEYTSDWYNVKDIMSVFTWVFFSYALTFTRTRF